MVSVRIPSQRPLAPIFTSIMYVGKDIDDNVMILGAVNISPGIYLTPEEIPGIRQLGDCRVGPVIASNGVRLPPNEVSRFTQYVRACHFALGVFPAAFSLTRFWCVIASSSFALSTLNWAKSFEF